MLFYRVQNPSNFVNVKLSFPNHSAEPTDKCVFINSSLDYTDQIDHSRKLISQFIGALQFIPLNRVFPKKSREQSIFRLFNLYLFTPCQFGQKNTPQLIKNRYLNYKTAIHIITNHTSKIEAKFQHTKTLLKTVNILTFHNLYYYITSCEAVKIILYKNHEQFMSYLKPLQEIADRSYPSLAKRL